MLTRLDHIVLLTLELETAKHDYEILFGGPPVRTAEGETYNTALFQTGNIALKIMAPSNQIVAKRASEILGDKTSLLTSLAFMADDMAEAHRLLTRRGASPSKVNDKGNFRLSDQICAGIKTFILPNSDIPVPPPDGLRLDHLVINAPIPDRAIAHYGARLGLRFALDRTSTDWGARFMFFKLGDLVLEIIHRLDANHNPAHSDHIWGLTWKVDDLANHHERLSASGVTVSEIRTGRKPGTQVFTAKSHSAGIPTLFLQQVPATGT